MLARNPSHATTTTTVRRAPIARAVALSVVLALLPGFVLANDLPSAKPEDVGMSSARLDRIGASMRQHLASEEMAGALGMIARHGKVIYLETWGNRDREAAKPMRPDTIFRIYSMTKPITSVAVMMLYEEGKFFLNDPVGKYIPELAKMKVLHEVTDPDTGEATWEARDAEHPITIRDLLRHTAGLTYGFFGNSKVDQQYRQQGLLMADASLADFVTKLGQIPLQYEPGTKWHYSVAIDVLGRLVEVTSGMAFDDFLEQRIFEPIGMVDTGFWVPEEKLDRLAQLYSPEGTADGAEAWLRPSDSKKIVVAPPTASRNYFSRPAAPSGGGGLLSTASDYLRFSQMMLNGGELDGVRLLSSKSVELMTRNNLGDIQMPGRSGYGFGLGFAVAVDQGRIGELGSDGEFNWGGAAGTRFWIDPQEELIGIFMVQILPHRTTLGSEFRTLTYQSIVD